MLIDSIDVVPHFVCCFILFWCILSCVG